MNTDEDGRYRTAWVLCQQEHAQPCVLWARRHSFEYNIARCSDHAAAFGDPSGEWVAGRALWAQKLTDFISHHGAGSGYDVHGLDRAGRDETGRNREGHPFTFTAEEERARRWSPAPLNPVLPAPPAPEPLKPLANAVDWWEGLTEDLTGHLPLRTPAPTPAEFSLRP